MAGSVRLTDIVAAQSNIWFILLSPIGFLIFLISVFAETNRLPFDMPEGETEIVGFHAEYSAMKFAMFFMAEYANMFTVSCVAVLLFVGGWEFLPLFLLESNFTINGSRFVWTCLSVGYSKYLVFAQSLFLFIFVYLGSLDIAPISLRSADGFGLEAFNTH